MKTNAILYYIYPNMLPLHFIFKLFINRIFIHSFITSLINLFVCVCVRAHMHIHARVHAEERSEDNLQKSVFFHHCGVQRIKLRSSGMVSSLYLLSLLTGPISPCLHFSSLFIPFCCTSQRCSFAIIALVYKVIFNLSY